MDTNMVLQGYRGGHWGESLGLQRRILGSKRKEIHRFGSSRVVLEKADLNKSSVHKYLWLVAVKNLVSLPTRYK